MDSGDNLADLLTAASRARLAWVTQQLQALGRDDDPAELKTIIDRSAERDGILFMRLAWYERAIYIIFARPAVKFVIDSVLADAQLMRGVAGVEPLPEDPRERALHLRRHRNTGPAKALPGARREYGGRR